ncbi:MAG: hypothetical protein ACRCYU_13600 [Nocardioides sp.]
MPDHAASAFLLDRIAQAEQGDGWTQPQINRLCRALRNVLVASSSREMQIREARDRGEHQYAAQLEIELAAVEDIHTLLAKGFV